MPSPLNDNLQDLARNLGDLVAPYVLREFYEEGTFTPTFAGSTGAGTYTYTAQRGVYRRVGDAVYWMAQVAISAITVAPTGNMWITGLPFTAANIGGGNYPAAIGVLSNVNYEAAWLGITAFIPVSTSRVDLYGVRDNTAAVAYPAASFTNANANIMVSGWYPAAS